MNTYHILNGDSLKAQFPKTLSGELIIARECLVDGNVQGKNLHELLANRAEYLESYPEVPEGEYYRTTLPEINKIRDIPQGSTVYCWFEEDLFCQVNFWFILHLFSKIEAGDKIYLVRPSKGNEYSFAHMNTEALTIAFQQASLITEGEFQYLSKLWRLYQDKNFDEMLIIGKKLEVKYNFLVPAILAEKDRLPDSSGFGRPERTLIAIMNELNSEEFSSVFKLFMQRESIYSFGDLQVNRMLNELKSKLSANK